MKRVCLLVAMIAACDRRIPGAHDREVAGSGSPTAPVVEEATLRLGDKVKAQWRNGKWYSGTLTAVYSDGTADVRYDDGDRSKGLPFAKIKLVKRPLWEAEVKAP